MKRKFLGEKKILVLLVASSILVGGLVITNKRKVDEEVTKPREYVVNTGDIIVGVDAGGRVNLETEQQYFSIEGMVEEIAVKKGQRINKGDFIAKLSDEKINSELKELKGELEEKKYNLKELKKQKNQKESLDGSSLELQIKKAEAEVNKLSTKISDLKKDLNNLAIYAKTSGVVVELGYEVGAEATALKPMIAIGDEKKAYLDVLLPQSEIVEVKEGQDVNVILESYPNKEIKGKVIEKSYVNSTEGEEVDYRVKSSLELNDLEVYHGMTGEVKFVIKGKENVLQIPNKFIYVKENKQMVSLLVDNKVQEKEIKTGFSDGKFTEVLEGLKAGEKVIKER